MTEIELDAGQAKELQIGIDSGEVNATGQSNGNKVVLSYGYFRAGQEVLQEPADPALSFPDAHRGTRSR